MKRSIVLVTLLSLCAGVAAETISGTDTVRVGNRVIQAGDPSSKVLDAGSPTRRADLVNAYGAKIGENWYFTHGAKTTLVRVNNSGQVVFVADVFD